MNRTGKAWLLIPIVLLVLAAFVLPFTLFSGVDAWYGSFLFWTLATVAVIALNAVVSADWKD
jgi:peptidoglycan/LPS O-acetylase OafA/YrhL